MTERPRTSRRRIARRATGAAILVGLLGTLTPTVLGSGPAAADQSGAPLLRATAVSASSASLRPAPRGAERSRMVKIDSEQLAAARAGDRLNIELFDDMAVTAVIDERSHRNGTTAWTGHLDGTPGSFTGVAIGGLHHLHLATPEGTYEVSQASGETYRVVEAGRPPATGEDAVEPPDAPSDDTPGAQTSTPSADGAHQIDVAVLYPAALINEMGANPLQVQIELAFAQTNQAFANSGMSTRLRLVGTQQVAAPTTRNIYTMLQQLGTPGDGVYDEAQSFREQTHADLVTLWASGTAGPIGTACGIANFGGSNPAKDSEWSAWSVVFAAECATQFLVFTHEIGHNLGGHHDVGASQPPDQGKPYARAFVDIEGRTLTAIGYYDACNRAGVSCTRIPHFSNPAARTSAGRVTGTEAANNALAMSEQAPAVANYRLSQIHPGTATLAGRVRFKGTAKAVTSGWAPGNVGLSYQWHLDGVPQPGATGPTFKLGKQHIGHALSVQVTASAAHYNPVSVSSGAMVVGKARFRTTRPRLLGKVRPGRTLTARIRGWKPKTGKRSVKVRYRWYRNGKLIKGARKAKYRIKRKDRGKRIHVVVTARKRNYETARRVSRKVRVRR